MDTGELLTFRAAFERELRDNILPYWQRYAVEADGDGFYGAVDLQNRPVQTANKSCVLNARILWTFAAAARAYPEAGYGGMAERAYRVLDRHFADDTQGGFFMALAPDNRIANDVKHTYAQAFALYALCQYYAWTREPFALDQLQRLFALLEDKTKDPRLPGYGEAFTRDWRPIGENRMADHNEPRSMNTHLHMLEAYAALYHVWPNPDVGGRLRELLTLFLDRIIRPTGHLGIFFDEAFNEVGAARANCSFGHDIEASWLLVEAAEILGDPALLARTQAAGLKMLDAVVRVGLDQDGGLFLESLRHGSHVRTNKHWWLQAEALVGLMNGYQLTRSVRYWEDLKRSWAFVDQHVIDHRGGEWFTKVNRLGEPYLVEPADDPSPFYRNDWKIDPWKCPYHNGRACLELIHRIDQLIH